MKKATGTDLRHVLLTGHRGPGGLSHIGLWVGAALGRICGGAMLMCVRGRSRWHVKRVVLRSGGGLWRDS